MPVTHAGMPLVLQNAQPGAGVYTVLNAPPAAGIIDCDAGVRSGSSEHSAVSVPGPVTLSVKSAASVPLAPLITSSNRPVTDRFCIQLRVALDELTPLAQKFTHALLGKNEPWYMCIASPVPLVRAS